MQAVRQVVKISEAGRNSGQGATPGGDGVVDLLVRRTVEISSAQRLDHVCDSVLGHHHGAKNALLGVHVLRWSSIAGARRFLAVRRQYFGETHPCAPPLNPVLRHPKLNHTGDILSTVDALPLSRSNRTTTGRILASPGCLSCPHLLWTTKRTLGRGAHQMW